jgi:hypothetical protein
MIYLNIILTLIFLTLLSFILIIVYIIKKYGKSITQMSQVTEQISPKNILIDNKQLEDSMKMLNNLFGNKLNKK